tara:strand:- start:455 stop:1408 length:954 start_codon:yes stop_codon:yes gene_type:complete
MKRKLLVMTPISHINGLEKIFKKYFILSKVENPTYKIIYKIIHDYDVIFTNPNMSKVYLSKEILQRAKKLKIICTASTGTNHIDLNFAKKNKIKILSLRNNYKIINKITSTAEHALALMMSSIRNINEATLDVKKGNWDYRPFIGRQMNNLVVGVVGYGRLGKMIVKFLTPLVKKIYIYEKNFRIKSLNKKVMQVPLKKTLINSDIITLHIHADKNNLNFINKKTLKLLKKNVLIINTSRGEIVDEIDLVNFLKKNKDAKYSTDVVNGEIQNKFNSKIYQYSKYSKQVMLTPHIGGMTSDAQDIAYKGITKKLISTC